MNYNEFEEELDSLLKVAKDALTAILLSEDRTSKHQPYTWRDEDINEHVFKSIGHLACGAGQFHGYKKPDGEDHIHNAIVRLLMAKWLIDKENKQSVDTNYIQSFNCPNCRRLYSYNNNKLPVIFEEKDVVCFSCISCGCQFLVAKPDYIDCDEYLVSERYNPGPKMENEKEDL